LRVESGSPAEEAKPPSGDVTEPAAGHPVRIGGRYQLLTRSGSDADTGVGRLSTWRARDSLLQRDVLLRIHSPGGAAARGFLDRALAAGVLSHPALAMVYDAVDENRRAYVVSEWVEGTSLADRLRNGPLAAAEARETIRRVAEGVAQAHELGLAVGGLVPDRVILTPTGSVTVAAIPAPVATAGADVRALGALLFATAAGFLPVDDDPAELDRQLSSGVAPDLAEVALAALDGRLQTAGEMVTRLVDGRRGRDHAYEDSGLAFITDRYEYDADAPDGGLEPGDAPLGHDPPAPDDYPTDRTRPISAPPPAVPGATRARDDQPADGQRGRGRLAGLPSLRARPQRVAPAEAGATAVPLAAGSTRAEGGATAAATPARQDESAQPAVPDSADATDPNLSGLGTPAAPEADDSSAPWLGDRAHWSEEEEEEGAGRPERRRRTWLVLAFPVAALLAVALIGWVIGSSFDRVTGEPAAQTTAGAPTGSTAQTTASPTPQASPVALPVVSATVYDPFGDGEPENNDDSPLAVDGDPASSWPTLTYRGSPQLGNLKPGVGLVFDLGQAVVVSEVTIATGQAGATVELRSGPQPAGDLETFQLLGETELAGQTTIPVDAQQPARYWLVWITELVPDEGDFSASLGEVTFTGLPPA